MITPAIPRLIAALTNSRRCCGHTSAATPHASPIPRNKHERTVCHLTCGVASSPCGAPRYSSGGLLIRVLQRKQRGENKGDKYILNCTYPLFFGFMYEIASAADFTSGVSLIRSERSTTPENPRDLAPY